MSKEGKNRVATLAVLLLATVATFAGCEPKGPAELAGENIDKGVQSEKDAITPPDLGRRRGGDSTRPSTAELRRSGARS